jgi:hypothetical protein
MDAVSGTPDPQAPVAASFRHVARGEVNVLYWQQLPNGAGKDHWFWTKTIAPSTRDYGLEIPDPAIQGALDAEVRVSMHGYTDTPESPDHHTRVSLNGVVAGDASWNGIAPLLESHATSPVNLLGGVNIVRVEQLNDTGAIVDGIYCDYVEVSYDRLFWSVQDALTFSFRDAGPTSYLVRGFTTSDVSVLEVTDPMAPRWISGSTVVAAGAQNTLLTTPGPPVASGGERRFYCVASPAVKAPISIAPLAPAIHAGTGADYILIAPPELAAASAALATHRESQGLRVKLVTTTQVYDHYGFGVEGPVGIRRFLKAAYATWPAPAPSHVVLVGDATIDPLDYLSTGTKNVLPFEFRQILTDGEIPSDHAYACVVGTDPLPELFVSRIPAITAAEATGAVSKIIQHDTSPPPGAWKTRVSHFCDKGGNFTYTLDALAQQFIPPGYTLTVTYADNFPTPAAMRAATLAELTGGGLIATYLGHGATGNWNTYLATADTPTLTSGLQAPFTVAFNCLNGYFASPTTPHSLAEALALEPAGGAVAVWASSGLGFLSQVAAISGFLYTYFFAGQTLGEATTAAKLDAYVQLGALEDNLWQYALFGDSATLSLIP